MLTRIDCLFHSIPMPYYDDYEQIYKKKRNLP
jgi:hypothetical protein